MVLAQKIATQYLQKVASTGKKTGDRTWVGLFIPLPSELGRHFPEKEDDRSPAHVTFLYVGKVSEEREAEFLDVLRKVLPEQGWPRVRAKLDYLDYFVHPDKERRVAHMAVRFSHSMAELRDRVKSRLEDAGFDVEDSFPVYRPHATLAYLPGLDSTYDGPPVYGSWDFNSIEVWGLPKVHVVPLGRGKVATRPIPIDKGQVRVLVKKIMAKLFGPNADRATEIRDIGPAWPQRRQDEDAWDNDVFFLRGGPPNLGYVGEFDTKDVQGRRLVRPVTVQWTQDLRATGRGKYVPGGFTSVRRFSPGTLGMPQEIVVKLNSARTPRELVQNRDLVARGLYSVLVHEVTHFRDLHIESGSPSSKYIKHDEGGYAKYLNQPIEIRAYMQQVVDEVLTELHRVAKATDGWIDSSWDTIEDLLYKSETWADIKRDLTPKNRQHILKAVGKAVARAHPILRKKYYKQAGVRENVLRWLDGFGDPLTLYRALRVDDPNQIDFRNLGRFWTPVKTKADSPYGSRGSIEVIIQAKAHRRDVDEFETVATMGRYPEEMEVRLLSGASIQVEGYWVGGRFARFPVRSKAARQESLDLARIEKFRKDFLMLMKNAKIVKNYDQAWKWQEAVTTWRKNFNLFLKRLRKGIQDLRWQKRIQDSDAGYWDNRLESDETWSLRTFQVPVESLEYGRDRWSGIGDDAQLKERLFRDMQGDLSKWEARVRRGSRKAWGVLKGFTQWYAQLSKEPMQVDIPTDERVSLEGFQVMIRGLDSASMSKQLYIDSMDRLKVGLRLYKQRARQVFPLLLQAQLPIVVDFTMGLDKGGEYLRTYIAVAPMAAEKNPGRMAQILAHEMGHHLYQRYLSRGDQDFWYRAITGNYGTLDLNEVLKKYGHTSYFYDNKEIKKSDPILYLQIAGLFHKHEVKRSFENILTMDHLRNYLEGGGQAKWTVHGKPITGYAHKNNEEAFCEAIGMLVGYGLRAVLPEVREWLKVILGSKIKIAHCLKTAEEPELTLSEALEITAGGLALLVVQGVMVTNAFFGASEIKKYLAARRKFHPLFAKAALQVADFFEDEARLKPVASGLRMFANSNPAQFQRALVGAGRALKNIRRVSYKEIDPQVRSRMGVVFGHLKRIIDIIGDDEVESWDLVSSYKGLFEGLVKARSLPAPIRTLFRRMQKIPPNRVPGEANPGAWFDMAPEQRVSIRSRAKELKAEQDEIYDRIQDPEERVKAYRAIAEQLGGLQAEAGVNLQLIEMDEDEPLDDVLKREKKLDRDGPTEYLLSRVEGWLQGIVEHGSLSRREFGKLRTLLRKAKTFATMERILKEAVTRKLISREYLTDFSAAIAQAQKNKALKLGVPLTPLRFTPKTPEQFQSDHDTGDVDFRGEWTDEEKEEVLGRVSAAIEQLEGVFGKGFCGKHARKLKFVFKDQHQGTALASYFGWDDRSRWEPRVAFGKEYDGLLAHELSHYIDDLLAYRVAKDKGLVPEFQYGDVGHGSGDIFGTTGVALDYWLSKVDADLEREPNSYTAAIQEVPEFVELMRAVASTADYARWKDKIGALDFYLDPAIKNVRGVSPWEDKSLMPYSTTEARYKSEIPDDILQEAIRLFTAANEGDTRKLNYWDSGVEIWARMCEQYVYTRLARAGIANPWLTRLTYDVDVEDAFVEDSTFEKKIEPIMDRLFARLKERKFLARLKSSCELSKRTRQALESYLEQHYALSKGAVLELQEKLKDPSCALVKEPPSSLVVYRGVSTNRLPSGVNAFDKGWQKSSKKLTKTPLSWSEKLSVAEGYFYPSAFKHHLLYRAKVGANPNVFVRGRGGFYKLVDAFRQEVDQEVISLGPVQVDAVRVREDRGMPKSRIAEVVDAVASRYVDASAHRRSIALMKFLSEVARRLGVARHVYVVGGAVRNFVIDRPIKDIDVVIDSVKAGRDSDWFAKEVARQIPAPTDITTNQYGVAILTVKGDWILGEGDETLGGDNMKGEVIEIANARSESYGKGDEGKGYKPTDVQPATIEKDVYRREFTFNTLMWRLLDLTKGPEKAEIVDLTGCGLRDLQEGVLKCPSDPDKTFADDPTRMLRAIKFTGKYGFKIPRDLERSISRNAKKMKRMPWEAIATILVRDVLGEPTARKSLRQMRDLGLLDVVSEMIREQKPFATYMANQLRRNRRVQLLLDLMELGVPANTPLHFLTPSQQKRLREITVAMPESEASSFADLLIKPPVDNKRVIDELMLPGPERRNIQPLARNLLLAEPRLGLQPRSLTERVIRDWGKFR